MVDKYKEDNGYKKKDKYKELERFLKLFTDTFSLSLCIKDFIDFSKSDTDLFRVLSPYQGHYNNYCMKVKYGYNLWKTCNANVIKLSQRCDREKRPFFGYCHMGYGEIVIPIMRKDIAIGALCCGPICKNEKLAHFLIKKKAKSNQFILADALVLLDSLLLKQDYELEKIYSYLGIVGAYIGEIFGNLTQEDIHRKKDLLVNKVIKRKIAILKIIEYINKNYKEEINVNKMANIGCCSISYINHEFKARTGFNFKAYLNSVRVEEAKKLLKDTEESITQIAYNVGFNDPDYFTMVFKKNCQFTPSEFRRKFAEN